MDKKSSENKFWTEQRSNAIIKISLWIVFISIIIIMTSTFNNKTLEKEEIKEKEETKEVENKKTYDEMIKELSSNNYEYNYIVESNDIKYVFNGKKCNGEEFGYKETNDEIIKYYINNGNYYRMHFDEKEEYSELFINIDENNLDVSNIFKRINKINAEKKDNVYKYKLDNYYIIVTTDDEKILKIDIRYSDIKYNLKFANIGMCDTIK